MIYELNEKGIRSFGLAIARDLMGPWDKVTDNYASFQLIDKDGGMNVWTDMISHGEVIRTGYNQELEYEPDSCKWIIQGVKKSELNLPYYLLPWKLGIIEQKIK